MAVPLISRRPAGASSTDGAGPGARVPVAHRVGAVVIAVVLLVLGLLGFADGPAYSSTESGRTLGLPPSGLLSAISVVGALFLASAPANLAVPETRWNLLAFRLTNVFFPIGAGWCCRSARPAG